jgi:GntR family transcriptional regulator
MPSSHFSTRPLYLQLRDALAERVAAGEWQPGAAIPNESDLAREFGVSAGTMRKALDMLEDEHLLTRRQGRGTFVNDQSSEVLAARFCNVRKADGDRIFSKFKDVEITEEPADEMERARLQLAPDDRVWRVRRIRIDKDDKPFMVEALSLPAALFPKLAATERSVPNLAVLAQTYGILLGKAEERVSVEAATASVAKALGIATGAPLIVLDRVVSALDRRPIEWRMGRCHLAGGHYLAEMK